MVPQKYVGMNTDKANDTIMAANVLYHIFTAAPCLNLTFDKQIMVLFLI